jgi:hypothetical protein
MVALPFAMRAGVPRKKGSRVSASSLFDVKMFETGDWHERLLLTR